MPNPLKTIAGGLGLLAATFALTWPAVAPARDIPRPAASLTGQSRQPDFRGEVASPDARRVTDWVVHSGDNGGLPFVVIDKIRAKVFVFDGEGQLRGATLALLGQARGDDSVPGIGDRPLKAIRPEERTTPAGRFVAALGHDLQRDILWIDYAAAISLHRVVTGNPGDHRLQRLATTSTLDKRISYGCVNVPAKFYESVVLKAFDRSQGIVYILPETKRIEEVFPAAADPSGRSSSTGTAASWN